MFARIPKDWNVEREGAVDFTLRRRSTTWSTSRSPPATRPSRGGPSSAPAPAPTSRRGSSSPSTSTPGGAASFLLSTLIDSFVGEVDDLERERVQVGDLDGYRVTYTKGEGDDLRRFDEVYLIDDAQVGRVPGVAAVRREVPQVYGDEIEDVLTTFRVEP